MAEVLLLEFDGVGRAEYEAVNQALGLNADTGAGDWPDGLIVHQGGASSNGWVVVEVWESQADQEAFMAQRLGPALQAGGIEGPPTRVEWLGTPSYTIT